MTLYSVVNPYPVALSQAGTGLNVGQVYIGLPGQDPQTFPAAVYWDEAGTDPASQPLSTIGGYIARAGSPAEVFAPTEYSIRVLDRFGAQVFYSPNARGPLGALITDLSSDTGADLVGFKGPLSDEVARTAYLNLIEVKRVQRWGAEPGNTAAANRLAIQKAINSASKLELVFPDGDMQINDLLTVPNGAIAYLSGQGCGVSRLVQTDMTKGAVKFNMNYAQGGGINGLSIVANVAAGAQGSSGIGLQVVNANDQFMARDFEVVSFDKCVRVDGSFQPSFKDFRLLYFANYGIFLSPYTVGGTDTAGTRWRNGKISNFGYLGANPELSDGILIHQGSGEYFDTIDVTQVGIPIHVAPPAASFARFLKFNTVLADTAYYEGWMIDGTNAPTLSIRMTDCWASGAGGGALRPAGSVRGAGLLTKGANLDDLSWIGGELRDNDCGGWRHEGGSNVRLIGASVPRNSRRIGFNNTYPGVAIAANASNWAVKDCRIGNFAQGVFAVDQAEAIVIEAGASQNFDISGNDLSNPGAGKAYIANGSSSLNWTIRDNLPNQTPFVNYNRTATYSGSSINTVPAASTRYLSAAGQQVLEPDAFVVAADPGRVRQLLVQTDAAPGAAQTYTYTVRKNGVSTVMTGTISGAASFQVVLAQDFTVSAGDTLSISLVTSAAAAAARHRWVLSVDQ